MLLAQIIAGISTHAPAQGATCREFDINEKWLHFNPRSRTGSDINGRMYDTDTAKISTHAPAQGATKKL